MSSVHGGVGGGGHGGRGDCGVLCMDMFVVYCAGR